MARDAEVDDIYELAFSRLGEILKNHPDQIPCGLKLILLIRKMERIGDHCSNIVEDIVFYIEARVLKHSGDRAE